MVETVMHFPELPSYLTVKKVVDTDKGLVSATIESAIHVDKVVEMTNSFSGEFAGLNPRVFRYHVMGYVVRWSGLWLEPSPYS